MPDLTFENTIKDPSFLFWTVIIYLTFLFHSWKIKEINEDTKSTELLFLSGALGYVFLKLSDYFKPIIDFIPKLLQYLKTAPDPFVPSFMFNLYFGFVFFLIYYVLILLVAFFILKIIQYCIDPNKEILHKYRRFILLKRYKIAEIFGLGLPLILLFIGVIFFDIGVIISLFLDIKFTSLGFWPIIYLLSPILGVIFFLTVLIFLIKFLYLTLERYFLQLVSIILSIAKKFQSAANIRVNIQNFDKRQTSFLILIWVYSAIIALIKLNEGNLVLFIFWIILFSSFVILIRVKKCYYNHNLI